MDYMITILALLPLWISSLVDSALNIQGEACFFVNVVLTIDGALEYHMHPQLLSPLS